jgi:hypothetical protein
MARAPDGKLWVATVQGLAMLDLPHLPLILLSPLFSSKMSLWDEPRNPPAVNLCCLPARITSIRFGWKPTNLSSDTGSESFPAMTDQWN